MENYISQTLLTQLSKHCHQSKPSLHRILKI
jgi:hypothetical protein